jgi:hypothetical protein
LRRYTEAANKEIVEKLMEDFRDQWEPAVDKLDQAGEGGS